MGETTLNKYVSLSCLVDNIVIKLSDLFFFSRHTFRYFTCGVCAFGKQCWIVFVLSKTLAIQPDGPRGDSIESNTASDICLSSKNVLKFEILMRKALFKSLLPKRTLFSHDFKNVLNECSPSCMNSTTTYRILSLKGIERNKA